MSADGRLILSPRGFWPARRQAARHGSEQRL